MGYSGYYYNSLRIPPVSSYLAEASLVKYGLYFTRENTIYNKLVEEMQ